MAGKEVPLSIVLRTVDKATAGVQAFNKRLEAQLKPVKDFKKAFGELKDNLDEKYGFSRVVDGFKGVGSAVSDLIGKIAVVGGAVGVAVAGVLSLIDHFDNLGDTAERLGTSADFLAAFRYAAERAGAPIEAVDTSLQTLLTNIGAAKAGTGKFLKFLTQISPVLARQVTSTHSLEEALGLLADAAAKLPDAARRSKLAAAALGDAALAPLLARGSKGIQELLTRYYQLAGAQGEAAEAAGKTDDALKDLHASTDSVKAALVTGLAPALTDIIGKMTEWLVAHREDVAKWAEDIGKTLPAAVDEIVKAVKGAVAYVTTFIGAIGGWKVAAGALAAVMAGPLVAAVAALSVALVATPFGQVLLGLTAIVAAVAALTGETEKFEGVAERLGFTPKKKKPEPVLHGGVPYSPEFEEAQKALEQAGHDAAVKQAVDKADADQKRIADQIGLNLYDLRNRDPRSQSEMDAVIEKARQLNDELTARDALASTPGGRAPEAKITVDFANVPKGARVTADPRNTANVDMSVGYQLGAGQ